MAFIFGFVVSPIFRMLLWTVSLGVAGVACVVNASRCGRRHCFFTGPFFLLAAAVALTYGLGLLPLGPRGWIGIGVGVIGGGTILSLLPERLWGKYRSQGGSR